MLSRRHPYHNYRIKEPHKPILIIKAPTWLDFTFPIWEVSYSNPVRQSLFTHRDAAEGRKKAHTRKSTVPPGFQKGPKDALRSTKPRMTHAFLLHKM